MEVDGELIPGQRGGSGGRFAAGRLYQFVLTNTSRACTVIVKDIQLAVLETVVDEHRMLEANTAENQYEAIVSHSDVGKFVRLNRRHHRTLHCSSRRTVEITELRPAYLLNDSTSSRTFLSSFASKELRVISSK